MKGAYLPVAVVMVVMMMSGEVLGYPSGVPKAACESMFPQGHNVDGQTSTPPYTLSVSSTTLSAGKQITLTLATKQQTQYPYYKGMFVQARLAKNCISKESIGTFSIPANDDYLQLISCGSKTNNAVSHKNNTHQTTKTFTWTTPSTYTGPIFFRATVVKNVTTFWTEIFSPYLKYSNDTGADPAEHCKTRGSSSVSALTPSFFLALAVIFFGLLWNL